MGRRLRLVACLLCAAGRLAAAQEPAADACPAWSWEASALDGELEADACEALGFLGIRPNHTVGPFWIDRCIGKGVYHEVWLVRKLDDCGAGPLALKIPASRVASSVTPRFFRRLFRNFQLKVECGASSAIRLRDPEHFVGCVGRGKLLVENGKHLPYTLLTPAAGRNLYLWRNETPKEPPAPLRKLAAVFDLLLRLFDAMDRGVRPELWPAPGGGGNASSRYYLIDLNVRNLLLSSDGRRMTVIDNDRTGFCCIDPADCDLALGLGGFWDRRPCGPLLDAWYKEHLVAKLLDSLVTLLTAPPRRPEDLEPWIFWEPFVREGVVPVPPLGVVLRWCCPTFWRALWRPLWYPSSDAMARQVEDHVEIMLSRLRPAYYRDWQRLEASKLVKMAVNAVYQHDTTWPPEFIVALRSMRSSLS